MRLLILLFLLTTQCSEVKNSSEIEHDIIVTKHNWVYKEPTSGNILSIYRFEPNGRFLIKPVGIGQTEFQDSFIWVLQIDTLKMFHDNGQDSIKWWIKTFEPEKMTLHSFSELGELSDTPFILTKD